MLCRDRELPTAPWKPKVLFGLILFICFFQCVRSVDFTDYYRRAQEAVTGGFLKPPYPVGVGAWGDFFQSPIVVLLIAPLTLGPFAVAKILWALGNAAGVVYVLRRTLVAPVSLRSTFFFLLLFTHGLSDVFLSGNINLPLLVLAVAGWHGLHAAQSRTRALGGLCLALAILIKVQPLIFVAWFVLRREWQRAGWIVLGLATWMSASWVLLPSGGFSLWWGGWSHALSLYAFAAGPGLVSFQSPPAALFRFLIRFTEFSPKDAFSLVSAFAFAVQGALLLLAVRSAGDRHRLSFSFLIAAFFLGGPFSWALTTLFLFPLFYQGMRDEIPRLAWVAALLFASIPKALWPAETWQRIAEASLPALCLIVITLLSLWRLRSDRTPVRSDLILAHAE